MASEIVKIFVHGKVDTTYGFFLPEGITLNLYSYPGLVNSCNYENFKYENVIDTFQPGDFIYNIHMDINPAEWNKSEIVAGQYTDGIGDCLKTQKCDLFEVCNIIKRNKKGNVTIYWMSCLFIEHVNRMCKSLSDIFLDYRFRDKKHKYKIINYITGEYFKKHFKITQLKDLKDDCEIPFITFPDKLHKFTIDYSYFTPKGLESLTKQNMITVGNVQISNSAIDKNIVVNIRNPKEFEFQTKTVIENEQGGDVITPLEFKREKIKKKDTLDKLNGFNINIKATYFELKSLIVTSIKKIEEENLIEYIGVCLSLKYDIIDFELSKDTIKDKEKNKEIKTKIGLINSTLGKINDYKPIFNRYMGIMELLFSNVKNTQLETDYRIIVILLDGFYDKLIEKLLT